MFLSSRWLRWLYLGSAGAGWTMALLQRLSWLQYQGLDQEANMF
jgi:DNA helicase IV